MNETNLNTPHSKATCGGSTYTTTYLMPSDGSWVWLEIYTQISPRYLKQIKCDGTTVLYYEESTPPASECWLRKLEITNALAGVDLALIAKG